jgi:hypothetical protein
MVYAKVKASIDITMAITIEAHGSETRSKVEERSEWRLVMSIQDSGEMAKNMAQGGTPSLTTTSTRVSSLRAIVLAGESTHGQTAVSMKVSGRETR